MRLDPGIRFDLVQPGSALPGDADLVILPGTKSTRGDLGFLRDQGWDIDIAAHVRRGGAVLGLCGGYQMLGHRICDPDGLEGPPGEMPGLGLLNVVTRMSPEKRLARVTATHAATGADLRGYEIHLGRTEGPDCSRPFARVGGRNEGATSPNGRIAGTYLHGLFAADGFRAGFLAGLGATPSGFQYGAAVQTTLDGLADHVETHLDLDGMLEIALPGRPNSSCKRRHSGSGPGNPSRSQAGA